MATHPQQMSKLLESDQFTQQRLNYSSSDIQLRLRQAAYAGDLDEVERLLQHPDIIVNHAQKGTNPQTKKPYSQKTALHQAASRGHLKVCQCLIQRGWSAWAKDSSGNIPQALSHRYPEVHALLHIERVKEDISGKLQFIFSKINLLSRLGDDRPNTLRVLSLACGNAHEFPALIREYPDSTFEFYGVDIDEEMLDVARKICADVPNIKLIQADATNPTLLLQELHDRFDLVILRQPDIFYRRETFESILTSTIPALIKPTGALFFSTYHYSELTEVYQLIKDDFDSKSGENYCHCTNGHSVTIDGIDLMPDQHSLVFTPTPALCKRITHLDKAEEFEMVREKCAF